MTRRVGFLRSASVAIPLALAWAPAALTAGDPESDVRASFRRVLAAPEARAAMSIERSDPFGGEPSRERGTVWILPGRGLRYKAERRDGQEIVIDRERELFLLYSPSERMIYRATYNRAPARLRRLVAEPEGFLRASLNAQPERRSVGRRLLNGYRLRGGSLGDSLPEVSVWMSRDPNSGLPRWVMISSATDTVSVEFRQWTLLPRARAVDLSLSAPKGTREAPLDPRELLERGGGPGN